MRDIQPKRPKQPNEPPEGVSEPEAKELYKKNTKGALNVPIANTSTPPPAPKPSVPKATIPVPKPPQKPVANPNVPKKETTASRPLFAQSPAPQKKNKASASGKTFRGNTRLGTRERKVLLGLLAILIIIGGLAAFLLLPKATINLALETAPLLTDQEILFAENTSGRGTTIPAVIYRESATVEGSIPVTSFVEVGGTATGTVDIVNRTTEEQSIKERSRLVTEDGTLFYMTKHAIVPAAGTSPSRVTVEVEAAEPGESGNISPQKLTFAALDESASSILYAEAATALTGGSDERVTQVGEADLEEAREAAQTQARSSAEERIRPKLAEDMTLLTESWDVTTSDLTINGEVGDEITELTFRGDTSIRVLAYKKDALQDVLKASLEEQLDENYMLFPGEISFTTSSPQIEWENNRASITARVTHTTIPTFSITTLKEKLAGRSEAESEDYLLGLPGVESASVDLWPFWARNVPLIQKRIEVDIVSDRASSDQ